MARPLRAFFGSSWPTRLKYLFCAGIAVASLAKAHQVAAFLMALAEIALVFVACNELARKSRVAATIASSVLLLLISVQLLVLTFSNSYLTLIFLSNIDSIEDLSGKMWVYLSAVFVMLVFIFLPIRAVELRFPRFLGALGCTAALAFALAAGEAVGLEVLGYRASPLLAYAHLAAEHTQNEEIRAEAKNVKGQPNASASFYRADVEGFKTKPTTLPEQPNVVVIFTEGLSTNIVDDERDIMPNVARYQAKSLSFDNYFNHTFATYRGLIGQIYSGFQLDNFDTNSLVPLPRIFEDAGYQTAFINVETSNRDFYNYLTTLGFQEVLDYPDEPHEGLVPGHLSDRQSFQMLLREMDRLGSSDQPFLLGMYTVGTHATFDSMDEKFGNGLDSELNKFYDADYQFGAFMEAFEASPWFDNTIVVYTADHCTYADMYFSDAFPTYERKATEVDQIPFFIYHKGVAPLVVDAAGRSTLDMAPTLLDYLDLSGENYFVGTSLFSPASKSELIECYSTDGGSGESITKDGKIRGLSDEEKSEIHRVVRRYYVAKQQEPMKPE